MGQGRQPLLMGHTGTTATMTGGQEERNKGGGDEEMRGTTVKKGTRDALGLSYVFFFFLYFSLTHFLGIN